jgi:hypothetical protein
MKYFTVTYKLIKRSIITICEASVNVGVILEEEKVELNLRLGVSCLVHNSVN